MFDIFSAVHENVEHEEHYVGLGTGILNCIESGITAFIEGDQFPINSGSNWKTICEGDEHLQELFGKSFRFSKADGHQFCRESPVL